MSGVPKPSAAPVTTLGFSALPDVEKARFTSLFLPILLSNGLGAMGKRDMDLLVFACLQAILDPEGEKDNYDWARVLKITPAKVKGLRLEAYLKYGPIVAPEGEQPLLKRFLSNLKAFRLEGMAAGSGLESVRVLVLIENPAVKLELEQAVKVLGGVPQYEENREILQIDLVTFLKILDRTAGTNEKDAIVALAKKVSEEAGAMDSLKTNIESAEYASLTEGAKALKFLALLGDTFAEKPMKLLNQVKKIIESHPYHETKRKGDPK